MFAASARKPNSGDRSDQTYGQWNQNVLQRFESSRRDTSYFNPGNWDMIFLLKQTLSVLLWFSVPAILHTGTSQADLEATVKRISLRYGLKKKKGIIH